MPIRQPLVTYGVSTAAAATITVCALLQPWRGAGPEQLDPVHVTPAVVAKRSVDVVFAVDTTGSMGGLLEGAKRTVWSIATHIRQTDPEAELRIGLVAYRDIGDDYVTRDFALTGDLDAVFAELSSYRAAGGGDTPEDVAAALDDTLHKMQWRGQASKLVFLVGDAPPADRGDVPAFDVLAREAGDRQILLNTIRCGWDPETEHAWKQIAALGHGQFSTIQQDGGVQQIATPYDDKLAEISARIDSTTVIVGDEGARASYHRKMAAAKAAPAPAKADRAKYYATKGAGPAGSARATDDLVGGFATGAMEVEAVAPADLPAEMRGMDKPALKAEITRRAKLREEAQRELTELSKKRDEYLKAQAGAKPSEASFDGKVKDAIDAELKR
jgi:hypothetical protein